MIGTKNKKTLKKKKLMNKKQIKIWIKNGFEIGSHSLDHANLNNLDEKEIMTQLNESKEYFKKKFNIKVESFSYPYGMYNQKIIKFVEKFYKFAVTTKRSRFKFNKFDLLEIPRVPVNSNTNIFKFYLKVKTFYEDLNFKT